MLKIFSLTGFYGVTVFFFSLCTIGYVYITLHLHVQLVTHLELLYKNRMIVISSSFLEDAARNRLLCSLWLVYPFGDLALLICFFSVFAVFTEIPFACCTLSWRFNSEATQYSCLCVTL